MIAILFFSLGSAICIQVFVKAHTLNQSAQDLSFASAQVSSVASVVKYTDQTMEVAFELMNTTPAIRNMIRENKIHQIDGLIYSSSSDTMFSMDSSLLALPAVPAAENFSFLLPQIDLISSDSEIFFCILLFLL